MNLYWWSSNTGAKNLGDEITNIIFNVLFECQMGKASFPSADLISTGSVLGWAFERGDLITREKPMVVLGSGFMHPWVDLQKRDWIDLRLVRGYLTKNILSKINRKDIPVGDPGLLFSDLLRVEEKKEYQYGIIPHISSFNNLVFRESFSDLEDVLYIDFRTDDYRSVLMQMQKCEVIISQGLHGLIFSDSLGLPNVWMDAGSLHTGGEFKFYDYFSTVNRPFYKKISGKVTKDMILKNLCRVDRSTISDLKAGIRREFTELVDSIKVPA